MHKQACMHIEQSFIQAQHVKKYTEYTFYTGKNFGAVKKIKALQEALISCGPHLVEIYKINSFSIFRSLINSDIFVVILKCTKITLSKSYSMHFGRNFYLHYNT